MLIPLSKIIKSAFNLLIFVLKLSELKFRLNHSNLILFLIKKLLFFFKNLFLNLLSSLFFSISKKYKSNFFVNFLR